MRETFDNAWIIAKREFSAYFATPLAIVFLTIFVALTGAFAFYIGGFFDRGQADLAPFFAYHPWLYLLLVPAVAMRLWAEERKSGTIELLMTLPVSPQEAILGKFFAAWAFIGLALILTFPMWITVNALGDPDNGVILTSYLGSFLMAGAFLAIGSFVSAMTKNQVIAFVLAVAVCFLFAAAGSPVVTEFLSHRIPALAEVARGLSLTERLNGITRGVIALRDIVFFASFMGFFLFLNAVVLDHRKAD